MAREASVATFAAPNSGWLVNCKGKRIPLQTFTGIPKPTRGKIPKDHTGERFGRLTVLSYAGRQPSKSNPKCGLALWLCLCDCGERSIVISRSLVDGSTKSCGNHYREFFQHGHNKLPAGVSAFNQMYGQYKRSARARGYPFELTPEQFRGLTDQECFYCGASPNVKFRAQPSTNGHYLGNGVDRADNTLGYTEGNARPCCKQCNIAKGVLSEFEFRDWVMRAAARLGGGA